MALAALCWQAVQAGAERWLRSPWVRWGAYAAAALLAVGNAISSSRTGLLQLVMLLALARVWGAWRLPHVRRVLLVAVAAYGLALVVLPLLIGRDPFASGALARLHAGDALCTGRMTLWRNVLHLIQLRPLGWGWGELDYAHYMTLYPGPRFCGILDNAHNLPLHLAVELGVPIALLVCGAAVWLVCQAKPWRERDATRQLAWAVIGVIGLHSLVEYPLWYGPFFVAMGLCVLLLWPYRISCAWRKWVAGGLGGLAVVVLFGTAYMAWDYHRVSQLYLSPEARDAYYRQDTKAKVGNSWLFRHQVLFAELTTTPVTASNAAKMSVMAEELLHFSPEPRVIEKLIESEMLLGREEEVTRQLERFRAAFPSEYEDWLQSRGHKAP